MSNIPRFPLPPDDEELRFDPDDDGSDPNSPFCLAGGFIEDNTPGPNQVKPRKTLVLSRTMRTIAFNQDPNLPDGWEIVEDDDDFVPVDPHGYKLDRCFSWDDAYNAIKDEIQREERARAERESERRFERNAGVWGPE